MKYQATSNNEQFEVIRTESNQWQVGTETFILTQDSLDNRIVEIIDSKGQTHEGIIQSIDHDKKQIVLSLHQKEFVVDLLEPIDQKMLALGIDTKILTKANNIKAPMPGLILKTLVKAGDSVKGGDPLFILEAMKMENIFKAPDDATIKKILIKEGDTVDKNQELIVFD